MNEAREDCWPTAISPRTIGEGSGGPICWSVSTRKSRRSLLRSRRLSKRRISAALVAWGSAPMMPPSLAWCDQCYSSRTSTGSWGAAGCSLPRAWRPSLAWMTSLPYKPLVPEECSTQAPGDGDHSAPSGRSGPHHRPGAGAQPHRRHSIGRTYPVCLSHTSADRRNT